MHGKGEAMTRLYYWLLKKVARAETEDHILAFGMVMK